MLNIVCVKQGTAYSAEYVNILHDMVRRNLPEGMAGRFICYTDDVEGIDNRIKCRRLPPGLHGWWNKLWLFNSDLAFAPGEQILYFDLDTVITGALDKIVSYDGEFAILRDFYRRDGLQSSVMSWKAGEFAYLWQAWDAAGRPELPGGDQAWIEHEFRLKNFAPDLWQSLYPGQFVSYKVHCAPNPPKASRVVVFHGHPRPHECENAWVKALWKVGGGSGFELEQVCNTENERIWSNVRISRGLCYPWIDRKEPHERQAVIVGGGPSLNYKIGELKFRSNLGQTIIATNGTAKWLTEHGIPYHYHAILDARPQMAGCVEHSDPKIAFLLASQCDPDVFEAAGGHPCIIWHPLSDGIAGIVENDQRPLHLVGGGSTVGLKSIVLAYILGYRTFHLYGIDSSYADEAHHAYPQTLNDGERVLDVTAGERNFRSAPWMVSQVNEFQELATFLADEGCTITVAGDGLLPHVAREMMKPAPPTAADLRAKAILDRLPDGPVIGAEIGVFAGDLSRRLLARDDLCLYMVDSWAGDGIDYTDKQDWHASLSQRQQDAYKRHAIAVTEFARDRRKVVSTTSGLGAGLLNEAALDFVFIDADHSYEGCSADIAAWLPLLKPDGLLCGHDYGNTDFPHFGVTKAVDEFAARHGVQVDLGENFTWFIRKSELKLAA